MKVESAELIKKLLRLTKRLSEIVMYDFENLDNVQFNWNSTPNQWSIAECLLHVNLIFEYYIPLIEKVLIKPEHPKDYFKSGFFGKILINRIQLDSENTVKRSLKTPTIFRPNKSASMDGLGILQKYQLHQEKMTQLLELSLNTNLAFNRIALAKLPFIRLKLGDLLCVIIYHNERHIIQAQRIRSEELFPRGANHELH